MDKNLYEAWERASSITQNELKTIGRRDPFPPFKEYLEHMKPFWEALSEAHVKMVNTVAESDITPDMVEPLGMDDDVYTTQEFRDAVESTGFVDSDGDGVFTFQGKKLQYGTPFHVLPSEFLRINNPVFDGVVWYNK